MQKLKWAAKAITAAAVGFTLAVVQYNLEVAPIVMVLVATAVAGLAVFLVPNGDKG